MPDWPARGEREREVLNILYPWYKGEVFRRRDQMMRLPAFTSAFLVLRLVTMLAVPDGPRRDGTGTLFAVTSVMLFSGVFGYLILQPRDR